MLELSAQIRTVVAETLELPSCPPDDADLTDFGMTSLESVAVVVALEDQLGIEFPDDGLVLANFLTIERITEQVTRAAAAQPST